MRKKRSKHELYTFIYYDFNYNIVQTIIQLYYYFQFEKFENIRCL